ncbi:MAG: ABC transporter permease, partial [Verrucomicrobiales bacterium]
MRDFVNPMLVKEVRQGLRGRMFVITFLLMQVLLFFTMTGQLISQQGGQLTTMGATTFFWTMVCIPMLLLPLAGFGAIHGELKGKTLELITLSRLSARRIVMGKWTSLAAQLVLILITVLPYALLRYYLGGVDIVSDLQILFWLTACAVMVAGVCVGLSAFENRALRAIIIFGGVIVLYSTMSGLLMFLAFASFGGGGPTSFGLDGGFWREQGLVLLGMGLLVLFFLEFGALKVAPTAENHTGWIRFWSLLLWVPAFIALSFDHEVASVLIFFALPSFLVSVFGIFEGVRSIPRIYRPFTRWGFLGRILGWALFYPGWFTSMVYTAISFGLVAAFCLAHKGIDVDDTMTIITGLLINYLAVIVAMALARLFSKSGSGGLMKAYVKWQIIFVLGALFLLIVSAAEESLRDLFVYFPT